ncbi:MAG: NADH-quinone oxidoreductase subunit N [Phycisphaerae bacterium]|nr:NADH-quinone oxidoreductase subunit N [Phycisphaerae bacterium]
MHDLLATIWRPTSGDLWLCAPELALVGTIAAVLLVCLPARRSGRLAAAVSLIGVLLTLVLTRAVAPSVTDGGRSAMAPQGTSPMLLADNFTVFFRTLLMLLLGAVILLWLTGRSAGRGDLQPEVRPAPAGPEFFVLLLSSALGMVLMTSTANLLVMLIAIETASLPSYAVVAADKRSRAGAEASLKYVLFGAASASIMVFGITLLYGSLGTLDLAAGMAKVAAGKAVLGPAAWVGLAATGAGITFKIAAVPFHFWCPDVFEGAPIEVTTWLSVASKAAALGLLIRLVGTMTATTADLMGPLAWSIGILAAVTCTIGNLAALRQESVKRMLAYSSIAHAGYMMMAAAILLPHDAAGTNIALAALVAYILVYAMMNLGAFGVTAMVVWQTRSDRLSAFTGLGRRAPWLALPLAVCLFSLVGLPPLGGFAAKWWLLVALGKAAAGQTWLWGLVVVAVVNTAISLYYYVRVIRQMYLADDTQQPAFTPPVGGAVLANLCAAGLILLGTVLFAPLGEYARKASSNLTQVNAQALPPTAVSAKAAADIERNR